VQGISGKDDIRKINAIEPMSIHHITNEMVENKPAFKDSFEYQKLVDLLNDDKNILVAHNAKFDIDMLEREGIHP